MFSITFWSAGVTLAFGSVVDWTSVAASSSTASPYISEISPRNHGEEQTTDQDHQYRFAKQALSSLNSRFLDDPVGIL
ncbi:hypothetical protein [Rhizobium herbae]